MAAGGLGLLVLAGGLPGEARFQRTLQNLADHAALAGVNALGTSDAGAEEARRADAISASWRVLARQAGIASRTEVSVDTLAVTVTLAAEEPARIAGYFGAKPKTVSITGTAHSLPPDAPANWAWASRQHFAPLARRVVLESQH